MIPPSDRKSKLWSVIRVSSGNFLEMYDFMVFGYYASAIGRAFFPSGNAYLSLMLSLMTFGAGFLMRPLGAIVLGAYTDKHGRRAGLLLTLSLMSVGIFSIGCMPGYATIGLLAPLLVLVGRPASGILRGHGIGRRVGLFIGDRNARPQGLLCQLAIGEPTGGRDVRCIGWGCAEFLPSHRKRWRFGGGVFLCSWAARSFRSSSGSDGPSKRRMSSSPASIGRARLIFSARSWPIGGSWSSES